MTRETIERARAYIYQAGFSSAGTPTVLSLWTGFHEWVRAVCPGEFPVRQFTSVEIWQDAHSLEGNACAFVLGGVAMRELIKKESEIAIDDAGRLRKACDEVREERNKALDEAKGLRDNLQDAQRDASDLRKSYQEVHRDRDSAYKTIDALQEKINALEKACADLKTSHLRDVEMFRSENEALRIREENRDNKIAHLQHVLGERDAAIHTLEINFKAERDNATKLNTLVKKRDQEIAALKKSAIEVRSLVEADADESDAHACDSGSGCEWKARAESAEAWNKLARATVHAIRARMEEYVDWEVEARIKEDAMYAEFAKLGA